MSTEPTLKLDPEGNTVLADPTELELEIFELAELAAIQREQLIWYLDQFVIANATAGKDDVIGCAGVDMHRWLERRAIWRQHFEATKPAGGDS